MLVLVLWTPGREGVVAGEVAGAGGGEGDGELSNVGTGIDAILLGSDENSD